MDFSVMELNKYFDRTGNASSKMKDKVTQEIIDKRTELISQY